MTLQIICFIPSANGTFSIQSKNVIQNVTAFDITRKQIEVKKSNNFYKINASNGIYALKIKDSEGNYQSRKLIIQ